MIPPRGRQGMIHLISGLLLTSLSLKFTLQTQENEARAKLSERVPIPLRRTADDVRDTEIGSRTKILGEIPCLRVVLPIGISIDLKLEDVLRHGGNRTPLWAVVFDAKQLGKRELWVNFARDTWASDCNFSKDKL